VRFALVTVVFGTLCLHLVREIMVGLRSARIRYGRGPGERYAKRSSRPWLFWFLVVLFAMLALASAVTVAWVARALLLGMI
jgi:hypothetical protein